MPDLTKPCDIGKGPGRWEILSDCWVVGNPDQTTPDSIFQVNGVIIAAGAYFKFADDYAWGFHSYAQFPLIKGDVFEISDRYFKWKGQADFVCLYPCYYLNAPNDNESLKKLLVKERAMTKS